MSRTAHVLDSGRPGLWRGAVRCIVDPAGRRLPGDPGRVAIVSVKPKLEESSSTVRFPMPLRVPRLASPQLARVLRTVMNAPGSRGPSVGSWRGPSPHWWPRWVRIIGCRWSVRSPPSRVDPRESSLGGEVRGAGASDRSGDRPAARAKRLAESARRDRRLTFRCRMSRIEADVESIAPGFRRQWGVEGANELVVAMSADPPSSSALSTMLTAARHGRGSLVGA